MKGPLKLDVDELKRLMADGRVMWLTPGDKLRRVDGNRWAFELVHQWRQAEADALRET